VSWTERAREGGREGRREEDTYLLEGRASHLKPCCAHQLRQLRQGFFHRKSIGVRLSQASLLGDTYDVDFLLGRPEGRGGREGGREGGRKGCEHVDVLSNTLPPQPPFLPSLPPSLPLSLRTSRCSAHKSDQPVP